MTIFNKTNNKKSSNLLVSSKFSRRSFIKRAGLFTVSLGLSPYFIRCEEDDVPETIFYFAVISDTHIKTSETYRTNQVIQATAEIFNNYPVPLEFVLITGDLCDSQPTDDASYYDSNANPLTNLLNYMDMFDMPVHPTMGNHDYYTDDDDGRVTKYKTERENLYINHGVIPDVYYSKEYHGVKFYLLNSMQNVEGEEWEPEAVGSFGATQLEWLDNEMSDGKPCFFFFHHTLATETLAAFEYMPSSAIPFEVPRAESNLSKYNSTLPFSGYTSPIYTDFLDTRNNQIRGVFTGHSHWFLKDVYNEIPVFLTDAFKEEKGFDSIEEPMRYHIVECRAGSGRFNVYNESIIYYGEDALYVI